MNPLLLLLGVVGLANGQANSSYLELYSENDQGGAKAITFEYKHDLSDIGFNDLTDSICGRGVWTLHENINYNFSHTAWTQIFAYGSHSCFDLPVTRHHQASSVRYAGTGDLYDETVTIYHSPNWMGGEVMFIREEPYLGDYNNEGSSMIVTGESPWTVYSHAGFEGDAICLEPYSIGGDYYFGAWNVDEIGMPNNQITSVQKGCFSNARR